MNIEACLAAIRKYAPDHGSIQAVEYWKANVGAEVWVYFNDPPRDKVGLDEVYFTFIVRTDGATGKILKVTHYRSKKGPHGDSTLPP